MPFDFGNIIQLFLLLTFPLFQLISSVSGKSSSKNRGKNEDVTIFLVLRDSVTVSW